MTFIELILVLSFNLLSFLIGAVIGQKTKNNEKIKLNPIKIIQENREEKKIQIENDRRYEIDKLNFENIDNYNGSSFGQKAISK